MNDLNDLDLNDDSGIHEPPTVGGCGVEEAELKKTKRSLVLEYGLGPPIVNANRVHNHMRLGVDYRNVLIKIERARRAQVLEAMSKHGDMAEHELRVGELKKELEDARRSIALSRAASRSRSESAVQRDRAKQAKLHLQDARMRAREARARILTDPDIAFAIEMAGESAAARVRGARATCGLYWASYLLQEADMAASRSGKKPPEEVRWTGEGRISVQIQGGMDAARLWGTDTRIRIVAAPERPGVRRREGRSYVLQIRVESDDRGRPIWAQFPMVMHRPVPDGARIKIATVSRRRRGTCWDWRLQITIDASACPGRPSPAPGSGAIALNLGFAQRPGGGLRSGYLVGSDGWEKEVLAAKSDAYRSSSRSISDGADQRDQSDRARRWITSGIDKADAIRAQRDKDMNAMRAELRAWISAQAEGVLPEWFIEWTEHLASWRSPGRFAALAFACQRGWLDFRFKDDDDFKGYDLLERWRVRDLHLERYETGIRTATLRDRREGYRILAAEVALRYSTLVIGEIDLRKFQRSPAPEDDEAEIEARKRQQRAAAPSELRAAFLNAFGPKRSVVRSSVDITRRHHACGGIREQYDANREWTCDHCGATYDQDANACRNLLREWSRAEAAGEAARADMPAERKPGRIERMNAAKAARRRE